MKKILTAITLAGLMVSAQAQHHHGHHHGHHHVVHGGGWGWIAPALIGGAVVYAATRPSEPAPQTVIIQPNTSPVACPPGTAAFYHKILTPADPWGRFPGYTESYQFAGCR